LRCCRRCGRSSARGRAGACALSESLKAERSCRTLLQTRPMPGSRRPRKTYGLSASARMRSSAATAPFVAGVVMPLDADGARRVAHVQVAVGIHGEHRPRLGCARHLARLHARRDGHGVRRHEGADVVGVLVAQEDVGDLVVHQLVPAAGFGALHAMQQQAAHLAVERVVVAVGVPLDAAVGVGDELGARAGRRHRQRRDAVVVGEPVGVEVHQSQLAAEQARDVLVGIVAGGRGVERHVGDAAARQQRLAFGQSQSARIGEFDDEFAERARVAGELPLAPGGVGRGVVEVEVGGNHRSSRFKAAPALSNRGCRRGRPGSCGWPSRLPAPRSP
jgi:hypothetical protein